ncbi:MAG: AMP-binding protein [Myxococcaceae bacterium]|nr:AMP-binding protein [Myxococcaceae bacterium]
MSALDRFHASWPRGVAPSVVEHYAGAADHVAPAMTLWSGAERVAALLASHGLQPGERVGCALPPGVRWAQTLVACLMRGLVFCPQRPGQPSASAPRALIDETGAFSKRPCERAPDDGGVLVRFDETLAWSADQLDALIADVPTPRPGARIASDASWVEPTGLVGAVWFSLSYGGELHVGLTDEELHRLGPEVVCARAGRLPELLESLPTAVSGLAVIGPAPSSVDVDAAKRRGWALASLPF